MFKKLSAIFITLVFILLSCDDGPELKNDEALIERMSSVIKTRDKKEISLKELTNFSWDRVCIFRSYDQADTINFVLGFDWNLSERAHDWLMSEGESLLVFSEKRKVVKYVFFPFRQGDFSHLNTTRCYTRDEAVFKIEKIDDPRFDVKDK